MPLNLLKMARNYWPVSSVNFCDTEDIRKLQLSRLAQLLKYAQCHTQFYRRHYLNIDISNTPLEKLPRVNKTMLMKDIGSFMSDTTLSEAEILAYLRNYRYEHPFRNEQFHVWESSGSSGQVGNFVIDQNCMSIYDSLQFQRKSWREQVFHFLNPFLVGERIAYIGAINGHFAGIKAFERWTKLNSACMAQIEVFSILQPITELVSKLNKFQPTILATYPSYAQALASELNNYLDISPKIIYLGGETLSSAVRESLKDAFHCIIKNSYGSSEFLSMAWECDAEELHLNSDWLILEPIDSLGNITGDGEMSHACLLTNLANYVQPLIRYELSDQILVSHEKCSCGSLLPRVRVLGRCDDILYMSNYSGNKRVAISPMVITGCIEDMANVLNYQVIQESENALTIKVPDQQDYKNKAINLKRVLNHFLESADLENVEVTIKNIALSGTISGKVKKVLALKS